MHACMHAVPVCNSSIKYAYNYYFEPSMQLKRKISIIEYEYNNSTALKFYVVPNISAFIFRGTVAANMHVYIYYVIYYMYMHVCMFVCTCIICIYIVQHVHACVFIRSC